MKKSETSKEISTALAKFQAEVQNPKLTATNPHVKSKYAPLAEILNTVRPILSKYGLSILQEVCSDETRDDRVIVITTLFHESGEWLESNPLSLPSGQKLKDGSIKIDQQTYGSASTYAKRYQLQAFCGVAGEEDMDGEDLKNEPQTLHIPNNMVSTPSVATLKAKYQLGVGNLSGFDDWYQKLKDEGRDDAYINATLEKAIKKKKEPEPAA